MVRLAAARGAAEGVVVHRHEQLGAGLVGDVHPGAQVGGLGGVGTVAAGEVRRAREDGARAPAPEVGVQPQPDVQVDVLLQQHRAPLGAGARREAGDGARRQLPDRAGVAAPVARVDRHEGQGRRGGGGDHEARREGEGGGEGETACAGDGWSFARGCPGPAGGHASRAGNRGRPSRFHARRVSTPRHPGKNSAARRRGVRASRVGGGAGGSAPPPHILIPATDSWCPVRAPVACAPCRIPSDSWSPMT